eukprot:jgi/Botrbrau1/10974/Bobra.0383s0028.1
MTAQEPSFQAMITLEKFQGSNVVVVLPSRTEGGFACYDHFVDGLSMAGEPSQAQAGGRSPKALLQLWSLLERLSIHGDDIRLVGFSKGGVVLNQVVAELAERTLVHTSENATGFNSPQSQCKIGAEQVPSLSARLAQSQSFKRFCQALKEVHYLDVGLNCPGAYPTSRMDVEGLGLLAKLRPFRVFLHGTPRQWRDPHRKWILEEKDMFKELLSDLGVFCKEKQYFWDEPPSMDQHFAIISAFDPAMHTEEMLS